MTIIIIIERSTVLQFFKQSIFLIKERTQFDYPLHSLRSLSLFLTRFFALCQRW